MAHPLGDLYEVQTFEVEYRPEFFPDLPWAVVFQGMVAVTRTSDEASARYVAWCLRQHPFPDRIDLPGQPWSGKPLPD